jgi:rubrerythrin
MDFIKAKEMFETIEKLDQDSQKTILKALKLAEHIETSSKEFYEKEAEKNKGNELEAFFKFMTNEEQQHLEKIEELEKKIEEKNLKEVNFTKYDVPKIKNIPAGKEEMTVLLYALWREKKAADFYEKASQKTSGVIKSFFEELAKFEKGHVALLEEYVESMNNANELIMG